MYVGHLAVALGAIRFRRTVPLWLLLLASQAADYLQWGIGLFAEYSRAQLYSHSLPSIALFATLFALIYGQISSDWRGALLVGGLYVSHALLDLVTGVKVLWPGTIGIGACVYERPLLDFVLESAIALGGWLLYRWTLGPRRRSATAMAVLATLVMAQAVLDTAQYVRRLRWPETAQACNAEPND